MSRRACANLLTQLAQAVRSKATAAASPSQQIAFSPLCSSARAAVAAASSFRDSAVFSGAVRSFSSSRAILTGNLVNVLSEEIKHEEESYAKPEEIVSGPPAPFTLLESADGDTLVTLVREGRRSTRHRAGSTLPS